MRERHLLSTALAMMALLMTSIDASAGDRPRMVGRCRVDDVRTADRPGWPAVTAYSTLTAQFPEATAAELVPPLWTSDEPPITLDALAQRAAPILIFSPLEFLRKRVPPIGIPGTVGVLEPFAGQRPVVYYRIRSIRVRPGRAEAPWSEVQKEMVRDRHTTWSCDDPRSRRADELDFLTIRYFFYYPKDEGIGGHPHDLEAVELEVRSRPFCVDGPTRCFYALTVASASGSAHGAGWYTNVLSVEDTHDTVLPLTFIVERDKHASSPDRDGNGTYQPYYDTNKYNRDAWGIRDVVSSGWLGGATFRGDLNDDRRTVAPLYPPHSAKHLQELYTATTERPWGKATYRLEPSERNEACDRPVGHTDDDQRLKHLMDGKNFCGEGETEVKHGTFGLADFFQAISPGPSGRYGFMSYFQRLSFAMRHDDGFGVSMVVPVGGELPLFGGWLVPKINFVPTWKGPFRPNADVQSFATDLLYAPTGSRVTDWYLSGGAERWLDTQSSVLRWGAAGEAGLKFRFNVENLQKVLGFQFVGFRLAVRTTQRREREVGLVVLPSGWNTRLIFEAGAGSW
jgi:hypothetical protein